MSVLTKDELIELTGGLRQGAAQIRWIKKSLGIEAPRRADGHPMITWEQVNRGKVDAERKSAIKWKNAA